MTLEKAKTLMAGAILYEVDSCFGPHRRTTTAEPGHTWNDNDPLVSLDHLTKRFDGLGGHDFYPCFCFFESYDECRAHEMNPFG